MAGRVLIVLWALMPFTAMAATYEVGAKTGCAVAHKPAPDAAYRGETDVNDWAVAPADMAPSPLGAEDFADTHIELKLPMRNYVGENQYHLDDSNMDINLGIIHVPQDGQVTLNSKPLTTEGVNDCRESIP